MGLKLSADTAGNEATANSTKHSTDGFQGTDVGISPSSSERIPSSGRTDTPALAESGPTTMVIDLQAGQTNSMNDLQVKNNQTNTIADCTTLTNGPSCEDEFRLNLFGTYIYPLRWITLSTLYSWLGPLSSIAMIIGCVMPYVPQYMTIYKTSNCSGFSTYVCLTLLVANILRVAFWFGHPFELPLLIQSGVMIVAQILLLELCARVKRKNAVSAERRTFLSLNPRYFWRWTDIMSYIQFLCLMTALLAIAMYYLIECKPFVEVTGYLALVIESMLGLPQVIRNLKKKSVEGMSLSMVLMWLGGDMFKTCYFIANGVPFQFWLCGSLQITIDLIILMQVCIYTKTAKSKKCYGFFPLACQRG